MESAGMDFIGARMRGRYRALIRQLVPLIERGDWPGVIDHIEREWRVWDILFVWNSLRQIAFAKPLVNGKPLEEEEAVLEAILRRRLMTYFLEMGWWGAVAGDERGKCDPLLATPGQLEEAIIRKGEAGNAPGGMEEMFRKIGVGMAKILAQSEANGATLAGIEGDTAFVAGEERRRKEAREKAAKKAAAARAEAEEGAEEKPYKERMEEAAAQVKSKLKEWKEEGKMGQAYSILAACRYVCKNYGTVRNQKTGAVIPGRGLNGMDGKPLKPETLRDYIKPSRKKTKRRKQP